MDLTSVKPRTLPRTLATILFYVGILLGIVFLGYTVWADIEATLFDPAYDADESLRTLKCPLLLTNGESGVVSASFRNTSDGSIKPLVRAHISDGRVTLMREYQELVTISPGKSETRSWEVYPEDAVYDRFILVRVTQHAYFPVPSRTATCGILVMDIPFLSSRAVVAIVVALIIACTYLGLRLWMKYNRPLQRRARTVSQGFLWMAGVLGAGILSTILGWWFAASLLFVLTVLLLMVVSAYIFLTA